MILSVTLSNPCGNVCEKLSKPYQPKASEYCTELKKCYVNLVGKNEAPFNAILSKIEELMENETLDQNERVEQLVSCYKEQLCIADFYDNYKRWYSLLSNSMIMEE